MDSLADDGPNITFQPGALTFLRGKSIQVQSDVFAIASWIFASPGVDGDSKFLIPGPRVFGVRRYYRVYVDEAYEMVYDFDDQSDPPLLSIIDISLAS